MLQLVNSFLRLLTVRHSVKELTLVLSRYTRLVFIVLGLFKAAAASVFSIFIITADLRNGSGVIFRTRTYLLPMILIEVRLRILQDEELRLCLGLCFLKRWVLL